MGLIFPKGTGIFEKQLLWVLLKQDPSIVKREYIKKLETKIETLNQRTKIHTMEIRELKKELKIQDLRIGQK